MADKTSGDKLLYCSFCGKSQHEVRKLIAGPSVFICDECIELCNDIIREEGATADSARADKNKLPNRPGIGQILIQSATGQIFPRKNPSIPAFTHSNRPASRAKTDKVS